VTSAIELVNVSKLYRRYSGRQFATLKSALLKRSLLRDLRPNETFLALKDVSFTVRKGSTVGVIGRNGSGKSTALKLVAGITKPTSGVVRVHRLLERWLTDVLGFDWATADKGRRLDHIWVAPALADRVANLQILKNSRGWTRPSDHVPVTATLEL